MTHILLHAHVRHFSLAEAIYLLAAVSQIPTFPLSASFSLSHLLSQVLMSFPSDVFRFQRQMCRTRFLLGEVSTYLQQLPAELPSAAALHADLAELMSRFDVPGLKEKLPIRVPDFFPPEQEVKLQPAIPVNGGLKVAGAGSPFR